MPTSTTRGCDDFSSARATGTSKRAVRTPSAHASFDLFMRLVLFRFRPGGQRGTACHEGRSPHIVTNFPFPSRRANRPVTRPSLPENPSPQPPPRSGEGEQKGNNLTLLTPTPHRVVGAVFLPLSASGRGSGGGVWSLRSRHPRRADHDVVPEGTQFEAGRLSALHAQRRRHGAGRGRHELDAVRPGRQR